jgi:hypothetical protein
LPNDFIFIRQVLFFEFPDLFFIVDLRKLSLVLAWFNLVKLLLFLVHRLIEALLLCIVDEEMAELRV